MALPLAVSCLDLNLGLGLVLSLVVALDWHLICGIFFILTAVVRILSFCLCCHSTDMLIPFRFDFKYYTLDSLLAPLQSLEFFLLYLQSVSPFLSPSLYGAFVLVLLPLTMPVLLPLLPPPPPAKLLNRLCPFY